MGRQGSLSIPIWSPTPPTHQPAYIRVVWPLPRRPVEGYVLCARPEGCWVHPYKDGNSWRTVACVGRENGCNACGPQARYRWQGYVPIFCPQPGRMFLAQVTKEAAARNRYFTDPKEVLRGYYLRLARLGRSNNSQVQAEIETNPDKVALPPCPDVRQTLLNLWGLAPKMSLFEKTEVAHGS